MDVTQPLLRAAQGGARTRLLVDDRVVVVDAHAGTEPVARANPAFGDGPANLGPRRDQPHGLPVSPPSTLFGREQELERLTEALDAGDTAVVSGAPGLGKTALLHHLAATRAPHHPHGAVLLSARNRTVEDLLFDVFRAFYEVPGRRPGPDDLRRHLTAIKALIIVDDVADPSRVARALAEAAPYSRVALATEAEQVGRDAFAELVAGIETRDTLVAGVAFGDALAVDEDEFEDEDEGDEAELSAESEALAEEDDDDELTAEVDDDAEDDSEDEALAAALDAEDDEADDEPVGEAEALDGDDDDELTAEVDDDAEDDPEDEALAAALDAEVDEADDEPTAEVDDDDDAEDDSEDEALAAALDAEGDEADDEPVAEDEALDGDLAEPTAEADDDDAEALDGDLAEPTAEADDDAENEDDEGDDAPEAAADGGLIDGDEEPAAAGGGTTSTESKKSAKGSGDDD